RCLLDHGTLRSGRRLPGDDVRAIAVHPAQQRDDGPLDVATGRVPQADVLLADAADQVGEPLDLRPQARGDDEIAALARDLLEGAQIPGPALEQVGEPR